MSPTLVKGRPTVPQHKQNRKPCSTLLVSTWWGLWRRSSETKTEHITCLHRKHNNRVTVCCLNASTLVSFPYCVHLLDVQRSDNVAETLKSNVIQGKCDKVTSNWKTTQSRIIDISDLLFPLLLRWFLNVCTPFSPVSIRIFANTWKCFPSNPYTFITCCIQTKMSLKSASCLVTYQQTGWDHVGISISHSAHRRQL